GGVWSSGAPAIGTIDALGNFTGLSVGTATVSYTFSSTTGCFITRVITVNPLPAPIIGPNVVCLASTMTLTDAVSGGVWSSSAPSIASVGSLSGMVSGLAIGSATITYTLGTGCIITKTINVVTTPSAIVGPSTACVAATATYTDPDGPGTWTSST